MTHSERMKSAIERDIKAITLRPSVAQGGEKMTLVATSDAICTATDGDHSVKVDLGRDHGGGGTTPGPGFLARAALGSCLTQSYITWAAYLDVPSDRITEDSHTEYDVNAALGLESGVTCGYTSIHMVVEIDSPAPRAEIERVVETAERRSFMHANFTEEHPVERELRIRGSAVMSS